ncbi:hypothetical protein AIH01_002502 [Salmonella enterica subsp. enterica serovar Pomona]|uniref:hypothetical protein n=1 Tax=Salmonella enterica TaxID=28901 RepID=UPI0008FD61FF|nr:hypothetical protein [Salmonella enterica]EAA7723903.1 hypothetical protein [Salmonella enterica subsp. enterica serovar Pomona]EBL6563129.1 hypothetical protein [Salmonella enterica subsp. enterica serovar Muenchen]ECJ3906005.1 hypothetical protein [Salmonella enterica subsp. enterica serovar Poona]ECZ7726996.1 hypothetical protein [Salmonella enterica subsp. enterica serovar Rubislaw]EDB7759236.1 hypothetical protein [Salmonella enterica subsp. enterica serovar Urbana]EDT7407809.1 hypoth
MSDANSVLIGFVLLFSPCGKDACEWAPVTERVYATKQKCQQMADELRNRRPGYEFSCGEAWRRKED